MRVNWRWSCLLAGFLTVSACGGTPSHTNRPPSVPSLKSFFPSNDTPVAQAAKTLQGIWAPYQVVTIPGQPVVAGIRPAAHVTNAVPNAVSSDLAQRFANAVIRDAVWRQWASAHAQSDFLRHVDPSGNNPTDVFSKGGTETVPDCAVYPASMTLISVPSNSAATGLNPSSQYAFVSHYTGPCTITDVFPDGHSETSSNSFTDSQDILNVGWLHVDPVLGDLWVSDTTRWCTSVPDVCALVTTPAPGTPLPLPPQDQLYNSASPALQGVWAPYGVHIIPSVRNVKLPKPPAITNHIADVIDDGVARGWGLAVLQQATWTKWSWEHDQLDFLSHLGSSDFFPSALVSAATAGGKGTFPSCAVYPTQIMFDRIASDDRSSKQIAQTDQYKVTEMFSSPCTVTLTYPDGHSSTYTPPQSLSDAGSLRDDPLLGEVWFPDSVLTLSINR